MAQAAFTIRTAVYSSLMAAPGLDAGAKGETTGSPSQPDVAVVAAGDIEREALVVELRARSAEIAPASELQESPLAPCRSQGQP